jgi:asparagine synthase (glutamine-hydrolysing)
MCGIAGVLTRTQNIQHHKPALENVLAQLAHRGPDDRGVWGDEVHVLLGHTRLSILDLSPLGHQPMGYQDGRFWITFNGEIYNYLELRTELTKLGYTFVSHSDTEVLLAAYVQWGTACLPKLRGMFAFAIWDQVTQHLFLARDRTGEKPLYYWHDRDHFYFASELRALLAFLPSSPDLDPIAIDQFLHYQYVPEPRTPLKDIWKLPAAHYAVLNLTDWQLTPTQYWGLDQIQPVAGEPGPTIRSALEDAIHLTLRSDVPVGVALSGGLDSSTVAALAAPQYKDVLKAFSVGYPGRPDCDERAEAAAFAKQLGLPFQDVELRTEEVVPFFPHLIQLMDDPVADVAAYGHFAVMQLAAQHDVTVMLSGVGGDELFWGYDWMIEATRFAHQKRERLAQTTIARCGARMVDALASQPLYRKSVDDPRLPQGLKNLLRKGLEVSYLSPHLRDQSVFYNIKQDFRYALHYRQKLYTDAFFQQLPDRNPFQPFIVAEDTWQDVRSQTTQLLFNTWLVSNCLALGDRTSMASSLEVRLPLLDAKLIETVVGLQKQYPDQPLLHKSWLKDAMQDILPAEILHRPKRGFEPPYGEWIQALVTRYGELLLDSCFVTLGLFKKSYLEHLLKHCQSNYTIIYRLLALELWYRSVIKNESFATH